MAVAWVKVFLTLNGSDSIADQVWFDNVHMFEVQTQPAQIKNLVSTGDFEFSPYDIFSHDMWERHKWERYLNGSSTGTVEPVIVLDDRGFSNQLIKIEGAGDYQGLLKRGFHPKPRQGRTYRLWFRYRTENIDANERVVSWIQVAVITQGILLKPHTSIAILHLKNGVGRCEHFTSIIAAMMKISLPSSHYIILQMMMPLCIWMMSG